MIDIVDIKGEVEQGKITAYVKDSVIYLRNDIGEIVKIGAVESEDAISRQAGMKTPEEKIYYSAICEQMPTPHLYFETYEDAVDYAKSEQPAYRPYYIVEIVEHFEICGVVGR